MSDADDDAKAEERWRETVSERWAEFRRKWLSEHRAVPEAEFARLAGLSSPDASSRVSDWLAAHRVFAILEGEEQLFPLFQLGANGRPRPEFRPLLLAMQGRMEGWTLAAWLTGANPEFRDWMTPLEVIGRDPGAVIAAARRSLAEVHL